VVRLTAGGRTQVRVYQPTRSYLSQDDPRLHFGLGRSMRIETLEIQWAGRVVQKLTDLLVDQYHTVIEPRLGKNETGSPRLVRPERPFPGAFKSRRNSKHRDVVVRLCRNLQARGNAVIADARGH